MTYLKIGDKIIKERSSGMDKNSKSMAVSGITGFTFFLIANFTNVFTGSSVLAGCLQLCVNTFVFVIWRKAFAQSVGFKKFVAFLGVVVPCVMASITLWRVLIPAILNVI